MGRFRIVIKRKAQKDIVAHKASGNKTSIKRIQQIIRELENTPYTGIGNPEPLKYELSGFWSRSINKKDRMIYKVEENIITVYVISAMGHYNDK